jgi:hypothetical protein
MLTGVLAKKLRNGIGVSPSYQVQNPGAMKAHGTAPCSTRRKNGPRSAPFVTARPFKHFAGILAAAVSSGQPRTFAGITANRRESKTGHDRHNGTGND